MKLLQRYLVLLTSWGIFHNNLHAQPIDVSQIPVVLPSINLPFLQREAKITAQEYPLAQSLKTFLQNEDYRAALRLLEQYQEAKSPALLLLEAQLRMQQSQFHEAEGLLKTVLQQMPDLIRGHLALATVYQSIHKSKEAQKSLSQAISLGASGATHFAQLGYLNMQNNDPQSAIAAYQQALMLAPENDDIRQGLLFALVQSDQHGAARNLLSGMLDKQPENRQFWLHRANLAMHSGDKNIALSSVEVALRLGDNSKQARQMAMQLNIKSKNYKRALDLSLIMLQEQQLNFDETDKLLNWLASQHEWDNLDILLHGVSELVKNPANTQRSRLLYYQGLIAQKNQKTSIAKQVWINAIKSDPGNGDALLALAKLTAANASFVEADLYYQRAETLNTVALPAKLGRAQLYIDQLDYDAALDILQRTHAEYPHRHDLLKNIRILTNLVNSQNNI
ncbi:tetratricopeptide repeat protein [Aliiglaciecola sp. NS0011-25]|uniref:tetratricopeptide repeat protein n=1 Tax=Aliiglaciecola sp. NS0011-25 TaxID=3127654 RepID=UPI003104BE0F